MLVRQAIICVNSIEVVLIRQKYYINTERKYDLLRHYLKIEVNIFREGLYV